MRLGRMDRKWPMKKKKKNETWAGMVRARARPAAAARTAVGPRWL